MSTLQTVRDHDGHITGIVLTDLTPEELSQLTYRPPTARTPAKARMRRVAPPPQRYPINREG